MAAFRTKPVVKEAVQFMGTTQDGKPLFESFNSMHPRWLAKALHRGQLYMKNGKLFVFTLEGNMLAKAGAYIIRGVKGELYPCDESVFETSYELLHPGL